MPALKGAIAYRKDLVGKYQSEIAFWSCRNITRPLVCPDGCAAEYDMVVDKNASEQAENEYIEILTDRMTKEHPNHQPRIILSPV